MFPTEDPPSVASIQLPKVKLVPTAASPSLARSSTFRKVTGVSPYSCLKASRLARTECEPSARCGKSPRSNTGARSEGKPCKSLALETTRNSQSSSRSLSSNAHGTSSPNQPLCSPTATTQTKMAPKKARAMVGRASDLKAGFFGAGTLPTGSFAAAFGAAPPTSAGEAAAAGAASARTGAPRRRMAHSAAWWRVTLRRRKPASGALRA
mmetsp:Transcript_76113/g.198309  ORF Transcript_76113/g.198309 Transcript_76113/m.198309 type:complete len:209 (+) Transcript_76113:216-842(+)